MSVFFFSLFVRSRDARIELPSERAKNDALASAAAALPTGRIGRPGDIAQAVRLLLTGGFITGEVLHVGGGGRLV